MIGCPTRLTCWDRQATVLDSAGDTWHRDEALLAAATGQSLKRLPARRTFGFGWHAAFPTTRLVN